MYSKAWKALGAALVVLVAIAAWGAYDAPTIEGKVTVINPSSNRFTVETSSGMMTFEVNSDSMIMYGGETKTINDLKIGDKVNISYSGTGTTKVASHVDVVAYESPSVASTSHPYNAAPGTTAPSPDENAVNPDYDREHLPSTASSLPLIGLSGLLLIGLAVAVRVGRSLIG